MALTPDRNDPNYKEMMAIKKQHPEFWNDYSQYNKVGKVDGSKRPEHLSQNAAKMADAKINAAKRSGLGTKKSPGDRKLI